MPRRAPRRYESRTEKATLAKKLNGLTCTPTCPGGYTYALDGELLKKCRSMAFLMTLNQKTAEYIQTLIIFGFCQAVTGFAAWMLLRREEKSER